MIVNVTLKSGREVTIYDVDSVTDENVTIKQGTYRDEFVTGTVFGYLNTTASGDPESPDSILHVAPRQYSYDETWVVFTDADTNVVGKYRKTDIRGWRKSVA